MLPTTLHALGQSGGRSPGNANHFLAQVQSKAQAGALSYGNTWRNVQQFVKASQELEHLFPGVRGLGGAHRRNTRCYHPRRRGPRPEREMGVLKALGCTRGQVLIVHVGQAVLLGGIGGALGVALGYAFAESQMRPLALSMGAPSAVGFEPISAAVIVLGIVAISVLASGSGHQRNQLLCQYLNFPDTCMDLGISTYRSRLSACLHD